jgi:rRNA biogenesis protein RRP5
MGAIKRKAEQGAAPSKKAKGASTDRSTKRRKSDVEQPSPAKPKPESAAPKPSVFKDEEKSFPRGGASVLTPLEHKQIQIKANQDVLFEQAGIKRTGGDDGFSDMGSEDEEQAATKSKKKPLTKKIKKSHDGGEKDDSVRAEGLSYKVRQSQSLRIARLY